jgi:hypothetical protein
MIHSWEGLILSFLFSPPKLYIFNRHDLSLDSIPFDENVDIWVPLRQLDGAIDESNVSEIHLLLSKSEDVTKV